MQAVILFISLVSFQSWGHENFLPLVETLNSALNSSKKVGSAPQCFLGIYLAPSSEIFMDHVPVVLRNLKDGCIKQICNTKELSSISSADVMGSDVLAKKSQLEPIRAIVKEFITAEVSLLKDSETWLLAGFGNVKEPDSKTALASLQSLIDSDLRELTLGKVWNEEFAQSLREKYSSGAGEENVDALVRLVKKMSRDKRIFLKSRNKLGAPLRYKAQFKDLDYQSAVRKDLDETKKALQNAPADIKEIARLTGMEKKLDYQISKNGQGQMVDELDGQNISEITDRVQSLIALQKYASANPGLAQRIWKNQSKNFSTSGLGGFAIIEQLSPGIEEKSLTDLSMPNPLENETDEIYRDCLYGITISALSLPSQQELETFQRNLPEMRRKVGKAVAGKYSEVSEKILNSLIETVSVFLPPEKSIYLEKVMTKLREDRDEANSLRATGKNPSGALVIEAFGKGSINDLRKKCDSFAFHPIRDNTVTSLDGISVGSESIKNPLFGLGVFGHELGHAIRAKLKSDSRVSEESRGKQQKIEKCLVNLHKPFFQKLDRVNFFKFSGDSRKPTHFLEEDFADLIGAQLSNSPCQGPQNGDSWGTNNNDLDNHSSNFFRILHSEAASGRKMPSQCQELLKASGYDLERCF